MKQSVRRITGLLMALALLVSAMGCAGLNPKPAGDHDGFLKGYYQEMVPGPQGGVQKRWIKPGVDFSKYHKVMLDSVVFYFAPDAKEKAIDADRMKELSDAFNLEMVNALKDRYPIVAEPGADVLRLRVAITNLKPSQPVRSTVSSIIPVGIGISLVRKGVTGEWTGAGETGMECMALDSLTDSVVAVAQDSQSSGYVDRITRWGSSKDAFKFWAGRVRLSLDQAHEKP